MDKRRTGRPRSTRDVSPPASRTRSKSPARIENSGRDSAPIKRGRKKKTDTPSEEVSSSSQSSTPIKLKSGKKEKIAATNIIDDSGDNEEIEIINNRSTRLKSLRQRQTPVNYKDYKPTPTPSDDLKRSVSRAASSLAKDESGEDDEIELIPSQQSDFQSLGIYTKPIVNFFVLLTLSFIPLALITCSNSQWSWPSIVNELKKFENFCNVQALSFIIAIHSGLCLLTLIPIGKTVKLPDTEKEYKFNGLISAIAIVFFLFILELRNLDALSAIYNNIDRLLYISVIKNLWISTESFLLSKYRPSSEINPYGKSGRFIADFVAGREINPKLLGRFDIKRINYNESIILLLIVNISLLFKNIAIPEIETANEASPIQVLIKQTYSNFLFIIRNSEYNLAAFIVSGLLVLYALDALIYEHHLASSFFINDEGCGAEVLLRFAVFPFLISFLPRFLFAQNVSVNGYVLAIFGVLFILGLVVKRCSSCLKYEYRIHPSDPKFKDLVTLPTFQNRRLIVSKWWSRIRQPSLFGEILLHLSLLILIASNFDCASFFGIVIIIKYLIYRSIGINRKNALKYESSWPRYLATVKFNLLPRVY